MFFIKSSSESDGQFSAKENIIKDNFTWTLEKFSLCQFIADKSKVSPLFTSKRNGTIKWYLYLFPKDPFYDSKGYISLWLKLEDCSSNELTTFCRFYVSSIDGEKKHRKVMSVTKFNEKYRIYPCYQFLKQDLLLNNDNELLPNGNLTVGCEIFYYHSQISNLGLSTNNNTNESSNLLLNDIASMLESPKFSDCVIQVGDSKINVHKCILASRSEVFDSILAEQQYQSIPCTIKINDFCLDVVEEMINYFYTGKSPNINTMAYEMLEIGEKYKLERLKLMAEERLLCSLSHRNACYYLVHSELYSAEILKEWCLRFIYLNAENVVNREEWKEVVNNYPLLIAKLFNIAVNID